MKKRYSQLLNVVAVFIFLWLAVFWSDAQSGWMAQMVDNDGTPSGPGRDSVLMNWWLADTLGNPVATSTGNDSIWVTVYYPGGKTSPINGVSAGKYQADDAKAITFSGRFYYSILFATAEIDGTPREGLYTYSVDGWDADLDLTTRSEGGFFLYEEVDAVDWLDSNTITSSFTAPLHNAVAETVKVYVYGDTLTAAGSGSEGTYRRWLKDLWYRDDTSSYKLDGFEHDWREDRWPWDDPMVITPGELLIDFEDSTLWDFAASSDADSTGFFEDNVNFTQGAQGIGLISIDGETAVMRREIFATAREIHEGNFTLDVYIDPDYGHLMGFANLDQDDDSSSFYQLLVKFAPSGNTFDDCYYRYWSDTALGIGWTPLIADLDGMDSIGNPGGIWADMDIDSISIELTGKKTEWENECRMTVDDLRIGQRSREVAVIAFHDADTTVLVMGGGTTPLEIMDEYRFKGVIWAIGAPQTDTQMDSAQLKVFIKRRWDVGGHSKNQPAGGLAYESEAFQRQQITQNLAWGSRYIDPFFGVIWHHPIDTYDSLTIRLLQEAGVKLAFGGKKTFGVNHPDLIGDPDAYYNYRMPYAPFHATAFDKDAMKAAADTLKMTGGFGCFAFHGFDALSSSGIVCYIEHFREIIAYFDEIDLNVWTLRQYYEYQKLRQVTAEARLIRIEADTDATRDSLQFTVTSDGDTNTTTGITYAVEQADLDGLGDWSTLTTADLTAALDTLKYGNAVWVDDGANTNTVIGVDGIPSNPVGTIAAAMDIADIIGAKTIYFVEGTNETIGETMEHYEFIGVGDMTDVTIDLNGQDVDRSVFRNVIVTGEQGGTEWITADGVTLNAVDSLHICAVECSLPDGLSLKDGEDSYFIRSYSSVPGNLTPTLEFGDGSDDEGVQFRGYSGGLRVRGMSSGDKMSFESDGQLQIGDDCNVAAVIAARGMMTINDSTAGIDITYTASAQYAIDLSTEIHSDVHGLTLSGGNLATVASDVNITDGDTTNGFTATYALDGVHYQVAEGETGTNLNINTYLEFFIGPNARPVNVTWHGRLHEAGAPSAQDTIHTYAYDWDGSVWAHIHDPIGDMVGIFNSTSANDDTYEALLVDPNFVGPPGANEGLVRIAFSNYDPDDATADDLEENTEMFLDLVFLEYQIALTAAQIADANWEEARGDHETDGTFGGTVKSDSTLLVGLVDDIWKRRADSLAADSSMMGYRVEIAADTSLYATSGEIARATADTLLDTDTTGHGGDATIGGSIVDGGVGGGSGDSNSAAGIEWAVNEALVALKLDHLIAVADDDAPVDGSIIAHIASTSEDWSTFTPSTDALQAIRDRGDAAWTTATGFSTFDPDTDTVGLGTGTYGALAKEASLFDPDSDTTGLGSGTYAALAKEASLFDPDSDTVGLGSGTYGALAKEASLFDPDADTVGLGTGTYAALVAGSDSALISRIVGRKGWGIPEESGDDSTTAAQRIIGNSGSGLSAPEMIAVLVESVLVARDATKTDYQSTTGPGAINVRIYAYDSTNTVSVEDVAIRVKLPDGTPKHNAVTGADGWASMTLETGERYLYAQHGNYSFTTPACTLTVPADSLRDTIWASAFSPAAPDSAGVCLVFGNLRDLRGYSIQDAVIRLDLVSGAVGDSTFVDTTAGIEIIPYGDEIKTDATGYWQLIRIWSSRFEPWGTRYRYTVTLDGVILEGHSKIIEIPDEANVDIITLIR